MQAAMRQGGDGRRGIAPAIVCAFAGLLALAPAAAQQAPARDDGGVPHVIRAQLVPREFTTLSSETAARIPASTRGRGRAGAVACRAPAIATASASVAKAATSIRPAAIPALVRISLYLNNPIQTASR